MYTYTSLKYVLVCVINVRYLHMYIMSVGVHLHWCKYFYSEKTIHSL